MGTMASTAGSSKFKKLAAQLHDTGRRRDEQQREDAGQKEPGLPHLVELQHPEFERRHHQQQAVDAGRNRQRQHHSKHLARQAERRNAGKLEDILHLRIPLFFKFSENSCTIIPRRPKIRQAVHCMKSVHIFRPLL